MKKRIAFALTLALILFAGVFAEMKLNQLGSDYRERNLVIDAALDKDKSFDGKRHDFKLSVSVMIKSSDLFKFNDAEGQLAKLYYQHILETKADVGPTEVGELKIILLGLLQLKNIDFHSLNINIERQ